MVPYTHSRNLVGYGNILLDKKEIRMKEILESIQKTLNHRLVGSLYIFYQDPLLITYMEKQHLHNNQKITFVDNKNDTMSTLFHYANENLKGNVMVMNADVYLDEGFEKVNFSHLRKYKLFYAISR